MPENTTIETVLRGLSENDDYFKLNKQNLNCCHPGEINEDTGHPNEELLQYNYHQASIIQDRKLRTIPDLPVPSRILSDAGVLELTNMRLEDPNYLAL